MQVLSLLGSSRTPSNTKTLTDNVLVNIPHTTIHLANQNIHPIIDMRHHPDGFTAIDDAYESTVKTVLEHDVLVFSTPVYWYGMSGAMKNWIDRWSQSLRDERISFKSEMAKKTAFVVVVGSDKPRVKALPLILQFQHIFDFMNISFGGYIIGEGNKPNDILNDRQAIHDAKLLNQKVQELISKKL